MKEVSQAEFDALSDHADAVSRETWKKLVGKDATAALLVIGTLLAAVEKELGCSREQIIADICQIADDCDDPIH